MFIQTEATPNPATLKFLPGRTVMREGTLESATPQPPRARRWRERLFDVPASPACSSARDFITVTKARRRVAAPQAGDPRRHHGAFPVRRAGPRATAPAPRDEDGEEFFDADDADTVATIKELIETRVRPAVAGDGGDITFRGFRDGVVYLNMKGSCSGCPSSTATLKHGIQNLLRHFLPDVREVEAV